MTYRALLVLSSLALFVACGGTNDPPPATHHCADIVDACHDVDPGSGPLHDCHETAHEGVEATCQPIRESCVMQCMAAPPVDAGTRHDGGMHMHGDAGGHAHDGGQPQDAHAADGSHAH